MFRVSYLHDAAHPLDPEHKRDADDPDDAHRQLHDDIHHSFRLLVCRQPPRQEIFVDRAGQRVQTRGHGAATPGSCFVSAADVS